jgi:hypothetical protein
MVDRRRLQRLEEKVQKHGLVVHLRNGETKVFSEHAPLYLWALEVDEYKDSAQGLEPSEPTTPQGREALALREALENATPESRAEYEERNREYLQLSAVIEKSHAAVYGTEDLSE